MTESTSAQLEIIREVRDLLAAANVPWWLFGGWAVDFHLGEVTREHGDIEFYIWRDDAATVAASFETAAFAPQKIPFPDEAIEFTKDGHKICAVLLMRDEQGDVVVPGRWTHWPWPEAAFAGPNAGVGDLDVPLLTVEALLERCLDYKSHAPGAPALRERDVVAMKHLRALLASQSVDDW